MLKEHIAEITQKMNAAIASVTHTLNGLRTGRASTSLLEPIRVNAYGGVVPLTQVGSISVVDSRMLAIQVWDTSLSGAVVKAIQDSGLGLNPISEGQVVRVPLPELSEERRKEMAKKAHEYGEGAKVAIRNVRRDANDHIKKSEKDKQLSEDESKRAMDDVQKVTDDFIKQVDKLVEVKTKEIMHV